jgi:hypothetical protein
MKGFGGSESETFFADNQSKKQLKRSNSDYKVERNTL